MRLQCENSEPFDAITVKFELRPDGASEVGLLLLAGLDGARYTALGEPETVKTLVALIEQSQGMENRRQVRRAAARRLPGAFKAARLQIKKGWPDDDRAAEGASNV
jgi:hypothetical protein